MGSHVFVEIVAVNDRSPFSLGLGDQEIPGVEPLPPFFRGISSVVLKASKD